MYRDIDPRARRARARGPRPRRPRRTPTTTASSPTDDPRDVFSRDLDLPRGPTRERVRSHGHGNTRCAGRRCGHWRPPARSASSGARNCVGRRTGSTCSTRTWSACAIAGLVRTHALRRRARAHDAGDADRRGRDVLEAARRRRDGERPAGVLRGHREGRELAHDVRVHQRLSASRRAPDQRTAAAFSASCSTTS